VAEMSLMAMPIFFSPGSIPRMRKFSFLMQGDCFNPQF
jgi:hypothetical protein